MLLRLTWYVDTILGSHIHTSTLTDSSSVVRSEHTEWIEEWSKWLTYRGVCLWQYKWLLATPAYKKCKPYPPQLVPKHQPLIWKSATFGDKLSLMFASSSGNKQCPGRFLGTVGHNHNVSKSNRVTCCDLLVFLW